MAIVVVVAHAGIGIAQIRLDLFGLDLFGLGDRRLRGAVRTGGKRRGRENGNRKHCRGKGLQHGRLLEGDHEVAGRMTGPVDLAGDLMRGALNPA